MNIKPIGTMAHECFMFQAAIHSPKDANYEVMENWVKVYDGNLGTVLTDTYTVDVFLRNFSMKLAKLYDDPKARSFINGVLNGMKDELTANGIVKEESKK